jgi:6-phosphogluconolactonase (cycloisomerase 2 family)
MRPVLRLVLFAILCARPALAGRILFATAASQQRIDGFCLGADGALAATPSVRIDTFGKQPRRVLVGTTGASSGVLYVAEVDRIEAFRIGEHGTFGHRSGSRPVPHLDPRDLALSPDGNTLYVTHQGFLEAYALDAGGGLPAQFTSCVQRATADTYLNAQAVGGLLYVSANNAPGRIEIYRLAADGSLPDTGCGDPSKKDRPKVRTHADSQRTRIQEPKAFVVAGDMIYVEERALRRLIAFRLQPDGTFCDKIKAKTKSEADITESCGDQSYFLPTPKCEKDQLKKQRQQCTSSRTLEDLQYEGLVLHPSGRTLLGSQYFKGRIDSYRLRPETRIAGDPPVRLPQAPTVMSQTNTVMTPVRITATTDAVYVGGGEIDRVLAYRLRASDGVITDPAPFSRTDEQTNSFPNDVAVAMLSGSCQ